VTPTPLIPTPEVKNAVPLADAGLDQVVNPSALVILDGTGSTDADGDTLSYRWNQLSGPNVDLLSERTATPSFSAGRDGQTYIFVLTVRDDKGAVATDTVTVATKIIEVEAAVPVEVDKTLIQPVLEEEKSLLALAIGPLNWALFVLSALTTLVSLVEHSLIKRKPQSPTGAVTRELAQGRVVHFQTNEAIAGARVLLYGEDGKLRRTVVTNQNGEFATDFPPGQYTLSVQATGFSFAPAGGRSVTPERGILYSGGNLLVKDTKPMTIVIPMKPSGQKVGTLRTRYLHVWQVLQKVGRMLSWPIFVMGALLNTFLIFWSPSAVYLIVEVLYVGLVIVKVVLEVRVSPAYGVVRDAITHVPLDLAVVRLYDQKTNRLIMTRVTNGQGKFFALPPAGSYRVTITKAGYGVFSRDNVRITNQQDSVLQMTADLMPVVPNQAFSPARSGIV